MKIDTCHPCHLESAIWAGALDANGDTLPSDDVGEIEIWDIANPDGVIGGDFCDQAKEDAESPTYVHPFTEGVLTGDFHGTQLTAAYYLAHSDDFVVHCEEHEGDDHDNHDHDDHDDHDDDDHDDDDDDDDDHDDDDHDDGGGK